MGKRKQDSSIEKLARERLLSGKQLFDYRTHRLRGHYKDEAQARAILLRAEVLAGQWNKKLVLRYLEKRLLARTVESLDRLVRTDVNRMRQDLVVDAHVKPDIDAAMTSGPVALDKPLKAKDVAELLGVHVETIYLWARTGRIPCIKLRHRMRFSSRDIERWLAQQTTGKF